MKLYFFPALIPLASLLPGLLAAVGVLAGVARTFRRNSLLLWIAILGVVGGLGLWTWQRQSLPDPGEGSRLTARELLPKTEIAPPGIAPERAAERNEAAAAGLRELWYRVTPRHALSTPAVASGLLLVGTREGTLEAYSAETGASLWSLKKKEPVYAVRAREGRAFVGEGLHTAESSALTAVSLPDGKALWQREFLGHLETPPELDPPGVRLWQNAGPAGLWALEAATGKVLWKRRIGHADSTPLFWDEKLLISPVQPVDTHTGTVLYALDPSSGEDLWKVALPGMPFGSPLADRARKAVVLTTALGQLGPPQPEDRGWSQSVSVDGQRLVWSVELPGMPLVSSLLLDSLGLVVHTLKSGSLVALRLSDGDLAWKAQLGAPVHAPATYFEKDGLGRIAVLTLGGVLSLRDPATGREVQSLETQREGSASPIFQGGLLFVATPGMILSLF